MPSPYGSTESFDAALALVIETRDQTLPFFAAPAAVLDRSYSPQPGKWTMRQLLLHIADAEAVMLHRLQRIIADDQAVLHAFDENHWAQRLPAQRDLAVAGRLFHACRDEVIDLARLLTPDQRLRRGTHTERGPVTVHEQLDTIAGHTAHHLTQLRAIAEGRAWTKAI